MEQEMAVASELVSQGNALLRVENDSLLQVAIQRPRSEELILKNALKELELAPEEAKAAFYSIPYKDSSDGQTKVVHVEGPSINAALALARRWGNCTATVRFINEDREAIDVEGVFIDLESNFRVTKPWRVSKLFRRRDGRTETLNVQRLGIAAQAGASKALRNAILAGLPAYLVRTYYNKAREIAGGKPGAPAPQATVDAVLRAFERYKVTKVQLEKYVEAPAEKWLSEHVATLRGMFNALKDGQVEPEEIFGPATPSEPEAPSGPVTADSVAGGTVQGQDDAKKADAPQAATPAKKAAAKAKPEPAAEQQSAASKAASIFEE